MKLSLKIFSAMTLLFAFGCANSPPTVGNLYGWQSANPPRENMLGKEIYSNGSTGEQLIKITPDNVERSDVNSSVKEEDYTQISAKLEVMVKKLSIDLGASYTSVEKTDATDLKIIEVRNFVNDVPANRPFVFQCLTASSHTFSLEKKGGFGANIDATKTEIAKKFGVESAKVELKSDSEKPDVAEIKISNPNVCFSFIAARLIENNRYFFGLKTIADKYVDITGDDDFKDQTAFILAPGDKSQFRSVEFVGPEPSFEPWFRLEARVDPITAKPTLNICRHDRRGGATQNNECILLKSDEYDRWDHPYYIETFSYDERKYKVIFLNVKAKIADGKIAVSYARLTYPQYLLSIQ